MNDWKKICFIFDEYRDLMFGKALNILKDEGLAEDALYEAFLCLWGNIDKVDDPAGSRAIVLAVTITKNCALSMLAKKTPDVGIARGKNTFSASGVGDMLYEMPAADLIKVVNKLGGLNRNIFLLKYAYGFKNRKTAKTLNEPEINVEARLRMAQRKLRALLLRK